MAAHFRKNAMRGKSAVFTVIVLAVSLVLVTVMFIYGESETEVSMTDEGIKISGMYGLTVEYGDIIKAELIEMSMREIGIERKTNGYDGFGDTRKGHFTSDATGRALLFVRANSSPTIHIDRQDEDIYISLNDSDETRALFEQISKYTD